MPPLAALARLASSTSSSHFNNGYAPLPSWLSAVPSSPILSRSLKEGRPRWRKSWLFALPALVLLLWLLKGAEEPVKSSGGPREMLQEVTGACKTKEVLQGRKEASFWVAEVGASHLTIRPRSTSLASLNCPTLSSAFFTPRIHFSSLERRLLLPSQPTQPSPGIYSFPLLPPITAQLSPEVKVEVILDSGWFPGGDEGLPCGEKKECDYEEMIGRGYKWTEGEVMDAKGERPSYRNRFRPLLTLPQYFSPSSPSSDLPLCPSLSYLPGSWLPHSHAYSLLDPQGHPCRLLSPSLYANSSSSSLPSTVEPRKKRWLRLLGDSNLRTLLPPLAASLGINPTTHCLSHQGSRDAHPTTLLCWSDDLLLSFNWWFGNQGSKEGKHEGDAEKLRALLGWSARELMQSVPWEKGAGGEWPSHFEEFEEGPEAVFLSIGSHMPAETSLGMSVLLSALEPVLFPSDQPPLPLILALTSATAPSRLPPKYQPSRVMRNDLMIRATNSVIKRWAEERGVRTMDLYAMSRTAGKEMMKDPVHFWDPMYTTWTSLFFHAWQSLLPSSPFLSSPSSPEQGWEIVRVHSSPSPSSTAGFGVTDPLLMGETVVDADRLAEKLEEEQEDGGIEREKVDFGED